MAIKRYAQSGDASVIAVCNWMNRLDAAEVRTFHYSGIQMGEQETLSLERVA
jgi:hypothetical protein